MVTREEILKTFEYPLISAELSRSKLQEKLSRITSEVWASRTLFIRVKALHKDKVISHLDREFSLTPEFKIVFGKHSGAGVEYMNHWVRESDWVELTLNEQGRVDSIRVLAPCRLGSHELGETSRAPIVKQIENLRKFASFKKWIRDFFEMRGFLEVDTPTLVKSPGTEAHLDFFETQFVMGKRSLKLFLPPSPELSLKKLLSRGYGNIFELKLCFRNGEESPIHRPEFWMLEWYRQGAILAEIRNDCIELLSFLSEKIHGSQRPTRVVNSTWREQFQKVFDLDLSVHLDLAQLKECCQKNGIYVPAGSTADDLFHLLVIEKIEPCFDRNELTFVGDYPPSQAALARIGQNGWAERFEMFWQGMELANAYQELNDPKIQKERALEENQSRVRQGKPAMPLDEEFFQALESGMPPSAGIALGVERLFLAFMGLKSLDELRVP